MSPQQPTDPPPQAGPPPSVPRPDDSTTGPVSPDGPTAISPPESPPDVGTTPCVAFADSLAPDAFPGYTLLREIHRGGQGVVYQALQKSTKRKVALKALKSGPLAAPAERARFEREIEILGQLNHPNIVAIHDSGLAAGCHYLVMDYISGQPLDAWLATAPRPPDECLRVFVKICNAVYAAHLRGIVHRDLKPSNIRIDADGEPHILDFGLARVAARAAADELPPVTVTGQFMGSLPWASPEQAEAVPGRIDPRSDVYALGVMLYYMLTGRFPYEVVGRLHDVLNNILQAEPVRPRQLRPEINDELETIVLKCLQKERKRRYQTAGELAQDLTHYLAGEPIAARRDSVLYLLRKQFRRGVQRSPRVAYVGVLLLTFVCALALHRTRWLVSWPDRGFESYARRLARAPSGPAWSEDVAVIAFDDAACEALPRLAEAAGIPGVDPDDPFSWRRLHGALLERLAQLNLRVVCWDIAFESDAPAHDSYLIRGLATLRAAGTRVIVGTRGAAADGRPLLSAALTEHIDGWGCIHLLNHRLVKGTALLAVAPRAAPIPSLALATYAAARHPGTPKYSWNPDLAYLTIDYFDPEPTAAGRGRWSPVADEIPVAHVQKDWRPGDAALANTTDWHTACAVTLIAPPELLARHTVPYQDVLTAPHAALAPRLTGKLVIIGDTRAQHSAKPDRSRVDDGRGGRDEFHVYVHATVLGDLLRGVATPPPYLLIELIVLLVCATIGVWFGVQFGRRPAVTRWLLCLLASGAVVAVCAAVARTLHVIFLPASAIIGLWLGAALATRLERTRHPPAGPVLGFGSRAD